MLCLCTLLNSDLKVEGYLLIARLITIIILPHEQKGYAYINIIWLDTCGELCALFVYVHVIVCMHLFYIIQLQIMTLLGNKEYFR